MSQSSVPASRIDGTLSSEQERVLPPVSVAFILLLAAISLCTSVATLPMLQVLLPARVVAINGPQAIALLSVLNLAGGVMAFVAYPVAGYVSDRTTLGFGRRRFWILIGGTGTALMLLAIGAVPVFALLVLCYALFQISVQCVVCNVFALVPDLVPPRQRGTTWSLMATAQVLSGAGGLVLIGSTRISYPSYLLLTSVLLVGLLLCLFFLREPSPAREEREEASLGRVLAGLWIDPRRHLDFALVWLSRTLIILAYSVAVGFLFLYFRQDRVVADPQAGVTVFQAISTVVMVAASVLGGWLSDRFQSRKLFVLLGSGLMIAGLLALWSSWPALVGVAVALGAGFGCFLSADGALSTLVLPSSSESGKDLGLMLATTYIAQILIAGLVPLVFALSGGYSALFIAAAACAALGALLVSFVRSVR